jgi:hypothetical protein
MNIFRTRGRRREKSIFILSAPRIHGRHNARRRIKTVHARALAEGYVVVSRVPAAAGNGDL